MGMYLTKKELEKLLSNGVMSEVNQIPTFLTQIEATYKI